MRGVMRGGKRGVSTVGGSQWGAKFVVLCSLYF